MDLLEAIERVKSITVCKGDDETAHVMEDELYADFIKHISETGNKKQRAMATEILKTDDIKFARWCA